MGMRNFFFGTGGILWIMAVLAGFVNAPLMLQSPGVVGAFIVGLVCLFFGKIIEILEKMLEIMKAGK